MGAERSDASCGVIAGVMFIADEVRGTNVRGSRESQCAFGSEWFEYFVKDL